MRHSDHTGDRGLPAVPVTPGRGKMKRSLRFTLCLALALTLLAQVPARADNPVTGTFEIEFKFSERRHGDNLPFEYFLLIPAGIAPIDGTLRITAPQVELFSESFSFTSPLSSSQLFTYSGTCVIPALNAASITFSWSSEINYAGNVDTQTGQHELTILHDYADIVVLPTCTEAGYTDRVCTLCGSVFSHSPGDSALGHAWQYWSSLDDARHMRFCGNDARHTEIAPCTFISAMTFRTCTEAGYTKHTCMGCGYSYTDAPTTATGHAWGSWTHDPGMAGAGSRHFRVCINDAAHTQNEACDFDSFVSVPTCTEGELITYTCTGCGYSYDSVTSALGHAPGEWEVTLQPTNKKAGLQVKRCTRCGVTLETAEIPVLSEIWPDNTACSYGLRFRDEASELTDKWYMYTPIDLTKEGTLDIPLIASNRYRIGTAQVTIKEGQVSAAYTITADKVEVKHEFMAFLPGLDSLETVEPEALTNLSIPLGTTVDIVSLGGSQALFFMRLVVTYDICADGVQWWSMP